MTDRARFDGAGYPGRAATGPFLIHRGRVTALALAGDAPAPFGADAPVAPVLAPGALRWSLAYGANADPDRLADKGLDERGAVVVPASVCGLRRVWEARVTATTGAVPLTLAPAPGERLDVAVLGVHHDDVAALDASEGRHGGNYVLGRVGPVAVGARFRLPDALAYGPGPTTRLLAGDDGEPLDHPSLDQGDARARLAAAPDATLPAEPLPRAVTGPWPETPLQDLPLFVYGTLQPGRSRWERIAELVDVVGSATTAGRLTATPTDYPAAELGGAGTIHGTVLVPRGPDAARELFGRTDDRGLSARLPGPALGLRAPSPPG